MHSPMLVAYMATDRFDLSKPVEAFFNCRVAFHRLLSLEEENSTVAEVEIDEVLGLCKTLVLLLPQYTSLPVESMSLTDFRNLSA